MRTPLLLPVFSMIVGICIADSLGTFPPAWTLAALLATTCCAAPLRGRIPFHLSAALLFLVWGELSLQPFWNPPPGIRDYAGSEPLVVEGVVDSRPEGVAGGGCRVCLQAERVFREGKGRTVSGRVLLRVKRGMVPFRSGDRILFSSRLRRPRRYGIPGEPDYPRQLAYQEIFVTAWVQGGDEVILVRSGQGWRHEVDRIAAAMGELIDGSAPGAEGGVLKALLVGETGGIPTELTDAYARSGVNHVLSISGFHVGIIFLCVFQAFFQAARCSQTLALTFNLRRSLLLVALPVVVCYLFLSGCAPATVRSVLMIGAWVASLFLCREVDPIHTIVLAAFLILAATPEALFDLSFQLSFLAVWGLSVLTPLLCGPWTERRGVTGWFLLLFIASCAAILATAVPVAYYFHRISWVGIFSNLIVVPLMGYGAVVLGFVALASGTLAAGVAKPLLALAAWLVRICDHAIVFLARAPLVTCYRPGRLEFLLAVALLAAVTFIEGKKVRRLALLLLLLGLVVLPWFGINARDGELLVTFLSVGQGDCSLVKLPDGKSMLIDGGGNFQEGDAFVGERLLAPALWRLGVNRIDYLVLSHPHPDHLQGVLYVAATFDVAEFWESGVPSQSPEYLKLKWILAARGVPVRKLTGASRAFAAGGAEVEPLWPAPDLPEAGDANDTSLVFRLRHGKGSILFTGDVGGEAEESLLERAPQLSCSILKVGHHGSRHSSSDRFLAAASPRVAVISAGYGNSFRLPTPATVTRLFRHGIRVYRTDLDGSVQARLTRDGGLTVSTPWGHFD